MQSIELFTGAGGLALGISRAGFSHLAVVERDFDSCETILENKKRGMEHVHRWPLFSCDVRDFDYALIPEGLELLAAGVPCQPFSIGGKHKGHTDERNLFPQTIDVIRRVKPLAVLMENVRGLRRPSFSRYFGYIELMLTYPEMSRRKDEQWIEHLARLEKYHTRGRRDGLYYRVVHRVLNAFLTQPTMECRKNENVYSWWHFVLISALSGPFLRLLIHRNLCCGSNTAPGNIGIGMKCRQGGEHLRDQN